MGDFKFQLVKEFITWQKDSGVETFTDVIKEEYLRNDTKMSVHQEHNEIDIYSIKNIKSLTELKEMVLSINCDLKKISLNTVFSDGNPNASLMCIGEAPGENEDKQGKPFVGESGKLLDVMLDTLGFSRSNNVYITNAVFWRPPGNRRPLDSEIAFCRPFLLKHIEIIAPKIILLLGSTAAQSILNKKQPMSIMRENIFHLNTGNTKIPVKVTYHPSYLLRSPINKKESWKDLLQVRKLINSN